MGSIAKRIVDDLTLMNRVFCSDDYDRAVAYLAEILPFRVERISKQDESNGWVIPPKWDVRTATISKDGAVIFDGLRHPLRVISLSASFHGVVSRDELRRHLHYDHRDDTRVPFHFRQMYQSWKRDWGFCVPKAFFDGLEEGDYEVTIETVESEGYLSVLEYDLPGEREDTFVFVAHLDHPGMANDDLSGCAVGVELFKRLAESNRRYSYRLLIVPEIIGSELYLGDVNRQSNVLESMFLEALGAGESLAVQHSLGAETALEHALVCVLRSTGARHRVYDFRGLVGNDEIVWESHGIPMACFTRFPFEGYHSDADSAEMISTGALEEAVATLERTVECLESTRYVRKTFTGYPCLSNPRYDLYEAGHQPALGSGEQDDRWRRIMDRLPLLDRPIATCVLSAWYDVPEDALIPYLERWVDKGLLEIA